MSSKNIKSRESSNAMATKQRAKSTKKTKQPQPLHSHILSSLTSTAHHKHSGKRLHSRHSSHGILLLMLLLTGILLFSNLGALKAFGVSQGGNTTIGASVLGDPPSEGAVILFPETNTQTRSSLLEVSGTCPYHTLVSIYNNGNFVGSTACTSTDTFAIVITLAGGYNTLQAQNYDGMDQPGPATPQHVIFYDVPVVITPNEPPIIKQPRQLPPIINPVTPLPEAPQPSENPCYEKPGEQAKITSNPKTPLISIGCIHKNIFPGDVLSVTFAINGGVAPYAVNIDWKDGNTELKSVTSNINQTATHTYNAAGTYEITFQTTDSAGNKGRVQSVVIVNGEPTTGAGNTILDDIKTLWIEAPVPLYIAAVTLALGFWVGDVFQRLTNTSHTIRKHKNRHA